MASATPRDHAKKLFDGIALAKTFRDDIRNSICRLKSMDIRFQPTLAMISVGKRPVFSTVVRLKQEAAQEIGIVFRNFVLPANASAQLLLDTVEALNADESVHGISLQIPLGPHISLELEREIIETIVPEKDVDGFHTSNVGQLVSRASVPLFEPCTPAGCIALLESKNVQIAGSIAIVLGRSDIVGSPVATILRSKDATVIQCHSKTRNLQELIRTADIVIAAIGRPNFVKGEWLKPGAIVIDVGINIISDASRPCGQRIVGDVDFASALPIVSYITPVPGGVGPMNIALLMSNTLLAAARQLEKDSSGRFALGRPTLLPSYPQKLAANVSRDMAISQARLPKSKGDPPTDHVIRSTADIEPIKV